MQNGIERWKNKIALIESALGK